MKIYIGNHRRISSIMKVNMRNINILNGIYSESTIENCARMATQPCFRGGSAMCGRRRMKRLCLTALNLAIKAGACIRGILCC